MAVLLFMIMDNLIMSLGACDLSHAVNYDCDCWITFHKKKHAEFLHLCPAFANHILY